MTVDNDTSPMETAMPTTLAPRLARPALRLPSLLPALRRLSARIQKWRQATRERHVLSDLDDRMLRDVGLTRREARAEAARPFWDVR